MPYSKNEFLSDCRYFVERIREYWFVLVVSVVVMTVLLSVLFIASPGEKHWLGKDFWRFSSASKVASRLDAGADINARDEAGRTPLHLAAQYSRREDMVALLLQRGADIEAKDVHGWTPLYRSAAFGRDEEVLELLLEHGADINARGVLDVPVLHWAAEFTNDPDAIVVLLKHGAGVNVRDTLGRTALHYVAAWRRDFEARKITRILLEAGADPLLEDIYGMRPLQLAMLLGQSRSVIKILRRAEEMRP